jgi:ABC-type multidrug transport system fused ATPase/permease subunit
MQELHMSSSRSRQPTQPQPFYGKFWGIFDAMSQRLTIAIDGPAGAGKSTITSRAFAMALR